MAALANTDRLNAILAREGLDALVTTGFENITYLAGDCNRTNWFLRDTKIFAIAANGTAGLQRAVVLPIAQASHYLSAGVDGLDLVPYGRVPMYAADVLPPLEQHLLAMTRATPPRGATETLAAVLKERGLLRGRIGLDTSGLSPEAHSEITSALSGAEVVPATSLLREIRAVKTSEEQRRLRAAARIVHQAIVKSARAAREGVTERELAQIYEQFVIQGGGKTTFTCIGFGERGAYSNVAPTGRRLRRGDLIRYDVGCLYEFYHGDIARTFAFGEASEAARGRYRATLAGERRAIEAAVPGATAADVYTAGVEATRRAGIPEYDRLHCGHAIGLEVYEHPVLTPGNATILEPGMVLAIETPYYELGTGGFQPEDIILITGRGPECLTTPDEDLTVLE